MKKFIVCIYDKVANVYNLFGDFSNKGVIMRTFSDYLKDKNFMCTAHPSDYDIVICASIDIKTGIVESLNEKVCNCNELIEKDGE